MTEPYSFRPEFFPSGDASLTKREVLLSQGVRFYDTLERQVHEYIKVTHPREKWNEDRLKEAAWAFFRERGMQYGTWVYYPWRREATLIMEEADFVLLRTSRNQYKITPAEQELLSSKTIGIIGLSVGHAIAITLASERTAGTLRLADFDSLDLSNLNRIKTSLVNLGFPKVILAAREIAELDPFIKVELFHEGFHEGNATQFMQGLDLLIEECDALEMKLLAREKARILGIPVIMDTSDSGMIDVERFDLEPARPLMHGLIGQLGYEDIKGLSKEDKLPVTLKLAGIFQLSPRLKASMLEIDQSITTWPQLASDVTSGAGKTVGLVRKILLGCDVPSSRNFTEPDLAEHAQEPLFIRKPEMQSLDKLKQLVMKHERSGEAFPSESVMESWIAQANTAPSGGNSQPWKWVIRKGVLYLIHEPHFSDSLLDYTRFGSYLALGAAIYNLKMASAADGYHADVAFYSESEFVASFVFKAETPVTHRLLPYIHERQTFRNKGSGDVLPSDKLKAMQDSAAAFTDCHLEVITERSLMAALGAISASGERWRIVNRQGHHDTFHEELRWTSEETESTCDGIDVRTLGMSDATIKAFELAKDYIPVKFLREQGLAKVFEKGINDAVKHNSAVCLLYTPGKGRDQYLQGGQVFQQVWLEATRLGLSFQPISAFLFLFRLIDHTDIAAHVSAESLEELKNLKNAFLKLTGKDQLPLFMFCLGDAPPHEHRALRRDPKKSVVILE